MANEYLYGAYGHIGETVAQSAVQAGTTPVYIGTAPVNLVRDFGKAGTSTRRSRSPRLVDAQKKIGYSSDWAPLPCARPCTRISTTPSGTSARSTSSMCSTPPRAKHRKETATTKTLTFTGGRRRVRQRQDHPRHPDHRKE